MASSSASWRLNKPPSSFVSGHKSTMCSMVCCYPNHRVEMRHVSTTWALACAETVQQCPGMAQQVKARLLDSRVAYKMTTDHSSRQPVFFPRRTLADRICVCPDRASSYKSFLWVSNTSAYRGQFGWAPSMLQSSLSVADLRRRAGGAILASTDSHGVCLGRT